jgi:SAM-dependent methyltransferase
LPPERAWCYERFLDEYTAVRRQEGWGRASSTYFRRLPSVTADDPQRAIWRIRARSYQALVDGVVQPIEEARSAAVTFPPPLEVLDLGSGNGWLANRLSGRRHNVAAIDLSLDELDGLGAYIWYQDDGASPFTPIQAEFDRLPLALGQADLALFNGSLHYSTDFRFTLNEALRVLRAEGTLAILDTPVYRDRASGERMVKEREDAFEHAYGFRSNSLGSEHFLTWKRLDELAVALQLTWRFISPNLGVRWRLRPWRAKLSGSREPAQMPVIIGKRIRPCALPPT